MKTLLDANKLDGKIAELVPSYPMFEKDFSTATNTQNSSPLDSVVYHCEYRNSGTCSAALSSSKARWQWIESSQGLEKFQFVVNMVELLLPCEIDRESEARVIINSPTTWL